MSLNLPLQSVSETAFATAFARARESQREDRLFDDPFALTLAGDRGKLAIEAMPGQQYTEAGCVVRTHLLDQELCRVIQDRQVHCVVNLGAGLDTRPYRLPLPAGLTWVEVDCDEVLSYKSERLADHLPVCRLIRASADLAEAASLRQLLRHIAAQHNSIVILSEGVLTYLGEDGVAQLAQQLYACPTIDGWLTDLVSSEAMLLMRRLLDVPPQARVQLTFAPVEGPAFFEPFGWRCIAYQSCFDTGRRHRRPLVNEEFVSRLSLAQRNVLSKLLGVVTFVRCDRPLGS